MKRIKTVRIKPDPPLSFKDVKYVIYESKVQFPLALSSSEDGRYIIAGDEQMFYIYDIEEDYLLDVNLYLPGGHTHGHITKLGE